MECVYTCAKRISRYLISLLISIVTLFAPLQLYAGEYTLVDTISFERGNGSPVPENISFDAIDTTSPYTLNIYNGGLEDDGVTGELVSSSEIILNGVVIFDPSEFNQNITFTSTQINLQQNNTLSIELRGKPGGVITLEIIGDESDAPGVITESGV